MNWSVCSLYSNKHCMFEHGENKSNCSSMAQDSLTKVRKDWALPSIMSLMHSWLGNSHCNPSGYYKPHILSTKFSFLIWNSLWFPWTFQLGILLLDLGTVVSTHPATSVWEGPPHWYLFDFLAFQELPEDAWSLLLVCSKDPVGPL